METGRTMAKPPLVSLLVINFNGVSRIREQLYECMESLLATDYPSLEIFFVDNGSSDHSADRIRQAFSDSRLRVVELTKNIGYAGATNAVLPLTTGQLIGVLNNDLVFPSDWLGHLVRFMISNPEVSIVSPALLRDDRTIDSLGGDTDLLMVSWDRNSLSDVSRISDGKPFYVLSPPGAAFILRRELTKELNNTIFDTDYFAYYEDVCLGLQCNLMAHKVVVLPRSRVKHSRGATWGMISPEKLFLLRRNAIWTGIVTFERGQVIIMLPVWLLSTIYAGYFYYALTKDKRYIRVPIGVIFAVLLGLKGVWVKHSTFQPKKKLALGDLPFSKELILDSPKMTLVRRFGIALANLSATLAGLSGHQIAVSTKYSLFDRINLAKS